MPILCGRLCHDRLCPGHLLCSEYISAEARWGACQLGLTQYIEYCLPDLPRPRPALSRGMQGTSASSACRGGDGGLVATGRRSAGVAKGTTVGLGFEITCSPLGPGSVSVDKLAVGAGAGAACAAAIATPASCCEGDLAFEPRAARNACASICSDTSRPSGGSPGGFSGRGPCLFI